MPGAAFHYLERPLTVNTVIYGRCYGVSEIATSEIPPPKPPLARPAGEGGPAPKAWEGEGPNQKVAKCAYLLAQKA